jgi:hypothetical protein
MISRRRPCLVRNCARAQGPITTGVGVTKIVSSISFNRRHNAVWVPACAGTTWGVSDSIFKQQISVRDLAAESARALRHVSPSPREQRAQGRPGARCTRGLVCKMHGRRRTRAYRFSGGNPAFPARWFTAYSALSLVTGLSCHHRHADPSARLDTSVGVSGPRDFAVRVARARLSRAPASTASHRNVRDDRDPPLIRVRRAELDH